MFILIDRLKYIFNTVYRVERKDSGPDVNSAAPSIQFLGDIEIVLNLHQLKQVILNVYMSNVKTIGSSTI